MKKIVTSLLLLVVIVTALVTLPPTNLVFSGYGYYSPVFNFVHCIDRWSCQHEIGHVIDHEKGYISRSEEFSHAITLYLYYQIKYGEMDSVARTIMSEPGILQYSKHFGAFGLEAFSSPQEELYANIYANVDGDVTKLPEIFRPFYQTDKDYSSLLPGLVESKYGFVNQ